MGAVTFRIKVLPKGMLTKREAALYLHTSPGRPAPIRPRSGSSSPTRRQLKRFFASALNSMTDAETDAHVTSRRQRRPGGTKRFTLAGTKIILLLKDQ
jgi:hypothetical protein